MNVMLAPANGNGRISAKNICASLRSAPCSFAVRYVMVSPSGAAPSGRDGRIAAIGRHGGALAHNPAHRIEGVHAMGTGCTRRALALAFLAPALAPAGRASAAGL